MRCTNYVIKLGGSLITDKDKPYTINAGAIEEASRVLGEAHAAGNRLVVVHGGGSFGHYEVKRIVGEHGILYSSDAARIQAAMLRLALRVLESLLSHGVPATLHPPHTLCRSWPRDCFLSPIVRDVELGLVPVTYGDALPGENDDVTIVSGDDLAVSIASYLGGGTCLLFVTSTGGIIGAEGGVLAEVRPSTAIADIGGARYDVTGGITKKLGAAFEASRLGIRVVVTGIEGMRKIIVEGADPREAGTVVRV